MAFFKDLMFRHSKKITDYFSDAVRVYALKGEEDARWAAIVAARMAGEKKRKYMIGQLSQMESNVLNCYPHQPTGKLMADRLSSIREEIESKNGSSQVAEEEKEKLCQLNAEYFDGLFHADPSIFRRKYPKIF